MKTILLTFLIAISITDLKCQSIKGRITDSLMQPVQYVNIGIKNTIYGTTSDKNGYFSLRYNEISETDTLRISRLGYETILEPVNRVIENTNTAFILHTKTTPLNEVTVSSKKYKHKTIGKLNTSVFNFKVNYCYDTINGLGNAIGKRFSIRNNRNKIEGIKFKIAYNNFDSLIFRLNFYAINDGMPGTQLNNHSIFIKVNSKKTGWCETDLKKYNLDFDCNFIATLELVSKSDNGSIINFPLAMPVPHTHYYKFGCQNKWKKFASMGTPILLDIRY